MFKILDKRNGEVTAEQQAVFNKISTNNADGYVDGFLNSLRIAKMSSNVISIDSGLLSIQGFRSVNDTLTTYTVSVTPSEPIPFQLVATYSHYISDENDTLEITTRPTQELRREPLFVGQNAVYEVELAEFNMTADGIANFNVTLEKIVYNEQDLSELLDKVTEAEQNSSTALEKVNELETQVIEKQGTAVYIGGEAQTRVDFDSDPQTQIAKAQSDISDFSTSYAKKADLASGFAIGTQFGGQNITANCTLIRCSGSIVIANGVTVNAIDSPSLTATGSGTLLRNGYAVGDFFIGSNSPAVQAGGEWTRLAAGQTIVSSGGGYSLGATGGMDNVTLTIEQIPAHDGHVCNNDNFSGSGSFKGKFIDRSSDIFSNYADYGRGWQLVGSNEVLPYGRTLGGTQAHANMPPYYVSNIWCRTA